MSEDFPSAAPPPAGDAALDPEKQQYLEYLAVGIT